MSHVHSGRATITILRGSASKSQRQVGRMQKIPVPMATLHLSRTRLRKPQYGNLTYVVAGMTGGLV